MAQDLLLLDDLDAFAVETTDPYEILLQDLFHVLITPRGGNLDDPNSGLGLEDILSSGLDANSLANWKHAIESELKKDERVDSCRATITIDNSSNAGTTILIDISIQVDEEILSLKISVAGNGTITRLTT